LKPEDNPLTGVAPIVEGGQIADILAQLLRIRKTQLSLTDKLDYLSYYQDKAKGYKPGKKKD
jgi:hypothetical protein